MFVDRFEQDMFDEIAEGERWLAGLDAPSFSPALEQRVKAAVRNELDRTSAPIRRRWSAVQGTFAAAAMIGLAVLTGWYSTRLYESSQSPLMFADAESVHAISELQIIVGDGITDDSLDELAQWVDEDSFALTGASLFDALDQILSEPTEDPADADARLPFAPAILPGEELS